MNIKHQNEKKRNNPEMFVILEWKFISSKFYQNRNRRESSSDSEYILLHSLLGLKSEIRLRKVFSSFIFDDNDDLIVQVLHLKVFLVKLII